MAAVNPLQNLPILPPTPAPAAPPRAKEAAEAPKAVVAQPKTIKVAAPAVKTAKVAPPPAQFKLDKDKGFLPSPPSIGEKARAAAGKAAAPRARINIVG
jgi:hypothetical protein